MGVWTSSANMEEWLSEDVCRTGGSKRASSPGVAGPGVPARLMGLEKLKAGRGSSEMLELMDGERCWWGEKTLALLVDNFLDPCEEWYDEANASSLARSAVWDTMLEERLGKAEIGGTRLSWDFRLLTIATA